MSDDQTLSPKEFGALFKGFLEQAVDSAPATPPFFLARLAAHFGQDPSSLPIVRESISKADHPNLQLAIESYLAAADRSATIVGIKGGDYREASIGTLLAPTHPGFEMAEGPVEYENIQLADDRVLPCVARGLYLVQDGDRRHALFVAVPSQMSMRENPHVEVMSKDRSDAVALLGELRKRMRSGNVYRGQVVSLEPGGYDSLHVRFHRLRAIARADIILPAGVLGRIERQTIGFSRHRDKLLAAGRHLKRGLLLYGPPGTGKTLTAMYVATQMKERTTLLLTGRGLGLVEHSCTMARLLEPSTVILEDVDLIAEERTRPGAAGCNALLFELLNQMDGLADDADVIFLLTTNRPDILEPALASRPGRIDLAVELPAPDPDCRRRLFDLYARGLDLHLTDLNHLIQKTEGVSAAFIRELLRKAALIAADDSTPTITDHHLDAALHELAVQGGDLLRSLLGVRQRRDGTYGDSAG